MKTLFEICSPRPDILEGNIRESDFAADLAQVINGTAPLEYHLPDKFFANTHPTKGLKTLLKTVCQRLQGIGGSPVLRLDTQYGGGKTHALIALTHASRGMNGVDNVGEFIEPELVPKVKVRLAAFDGENADPVNGRALGDSGLRAYTPWGELAFGLAGVAGYEKVRQSDIEKVAPGSDTIKELFDNQPVLILLDELSIYLRKIKGRKEQDQLTPFLTGLFKAVSSTKNACVVFTLAIGKEGKASDAYSQENEFVAEKLDEATKVAGRVATLLNPTTEQETVQVLRRRLFDYIDEGAAEEIVRHYEQLWINHRSDLPTERVNDDRIADFRNGFPFHPALMDLFTDKLSTLSTFQRVRGMLRLLTKTIAHLWEEQPANTYAIHLHHFNPGHTPIRDEITTRLELSRFDPVIENDVSSQGENSLAQQLDEKNYAGLAPYGSFVARNILWNTFAFNDNLQGIDEVNLRYAILSPDLDIGFINDARQRFIADSAYLDDRPAAPLRFLTEVNLTVLIRRQTKQVDTSEARTQLQDRIRSIFAGKTFNLIPFAGGAYDVPDDVGDGRPNLVLISYDAETVRNEAVQVPQLVENIYKSQGNQGRFRQLLNNLVFLVADDGTRDEMKNKIFYRLALEAMRSPDRLAQLPEHQQDKVHELYKKSEQELAIIIQQCYRHLFYPSRNNRLDGASVDLAHTAFDLPSVSERPGNGQQEIIKALIENQKLLLANSEPPAPNYVRDNTPLKRGQISTAELRAEFRKDPRFPIMLSDDTFIKLVRLGIEKGLYVYQSGDLLLGKGDPYAEIKIDEQSIVFTEAYAKERNIFPRPVVTPTIERRDDSGGDSSYGDTSTVTTPGKEQGGDYVVNPVTPGSSSTPPPVNKNVFKAEAPLREALTKIWENARSAQVKKISLLSLRVFDTTDAFKLLGAINTVSGAEKQVQLAAEYETKNGSSLNMEFEGQVSDAQSIKDFLQPQLRAASETNLEITFNLTYSNGLELSAKEPEKITEKLARFATGAVFVEAYAEAC